MGLRKVFAFLLIVLLGLTDAGKTYHACPNLSVCVAADYCNGTNVVYNALNRTNEKYMCGHLEECSGYVCCSEPKTSARGFVPTALLWFFPFAEIRSYVTSILPTPNYIETDEDDHLCPGETVCVPAQMCNSSDHNTISNFTKCGQMEMDGWVCCSDKLSEEDLSSSLDFLENILSGLPGFDRLLNTIDDDDDDHDDDHRRKRSVDSVIKPAIPPHVLLQKEDKLASKAGRSVSQDYSWECGVTLDHSSQLTRIYAPVGDHDAKEGDFPWHVAISDENNKYLCSGVIVGEKVVVTVAHCVLKQTASTLLVRIGDVDLQSNSEQFPSKDATVNSLVIHPDYDDHELENDIAILKLDVSLKGLPNVRPACLPDRFTSDIGKCKVPGWGQFVQSTEELNGFSYQLRSANFHIIPRRECRDSLRRVPQIGSFFRLQKSALCARGYTSADTCKGDGGSGLVCISDDAYVLRGLVSWGAGCGQNLPGVYTDIAQFIDFIRNFESEQYISEELRQESIYAVDDDNYQYIPSESPSNEPDRTYQSDQYLSYNDESSNSDYNNHVSKPEEILHESDYYEYLDEPSDDKIYNEIYQENSPNKDSYDRPLDDYYSEQQFSGQDASDGYNSHIYSPQNEQVPPGDHDIYEESDNPDHFLTDYYDELSLSGDQYGEQYSTENYNDHTSGEGYNILDTDQDYNNLPSRDYSNDLSHQEDYYAEYNQDGYSKDNQDYLPQEDYSDDLLQDFYEDLPTDKYNSNFQENDASYQSDQNNYNSNFPPIYRHLMDNQNTNDYKQTVRSEASHQQRPQFSKEGTLTESKLFSKKSPGRINLLSLMGRKPKEPSAFKKPTGPPVIAGLMK